MALDVLKPHVSRILDRRNALVRQWKLRKEEKDHDSEDLEEGEVTIAQGRLPAKRAAAEAPCLAGRRAPRS